MQLSKYQRGMSSLGWLSVLTIGGFIMLCVFRLTPAYMEDRYIQQALRSLADENAEIQDMTNGEIRRKLSSFYMVNNIRSQSAKDIKIERKRDQILVKMEYEVRVPIMANVSAVMSFNNVWDSRRPYECCKPQSE
ncbi:MAG: DUF4845 domain-containing protein [Cellvibrionaceae bacterium]|nr:DUF4845 domain-containing protein [Cellvibrionaceae bacterium]